LILWGLFKKMAVADRLAVVVDQRYAQPEMLGGHELVLATICFAFQIYCDFSAYSDIATGTAKLFNIQLMRNFAYPYFSQSVSEFWRRWHISLSSWFRDYVYIPLGGSRASRPRSALNMLVTFLVSGFWHGAAWQFLCWGGLNGVATAATAAARGTASRGETPGGERLIPGPGTLVRILCTFAIVCTGWVFFRAEGMDDAWLILSKMFGDALSWPSAVAAAQVVAADRFLRTTLLVLAIFVLVEWLQRRHGCPLQLVYCPLPLRWTVYTVVFWSTLDLMPPSGGQQFIYFDF
jgi:D-alanyl-lipoteichoic acid acyltransferase DltB (MBOAT superfamily)